MVALVTGASGGIGRAIAAALFRDGFSVAAHYGRNQESALALCGLLNGGGTNRAIAVGADISQKAQVQRMFEQVEKELGMVDVLVNNAGIAQQKLVQDVTQADWDAMLGVNLSGTFYTCQCALRHMLPRHAGKIINISSMWGQTGAACEVPYSAVKAGVIGLTKALAKELGPSGITVNAVAPGVIQTDMLKDFTQEDLEMLAEETPLGRIGLPEDIAQTVCFLASEGAGFVTGQVFAVNGGFVI